MCSWESEVEAMFFNGSPSMEVEIFLLFRRFHRSKSKPNAVSYDINSKTQKNFLRLLRFTSKKY